MKKQLLLLRTNKTYTKFLLSLLVMLCVNFGFAQVNYNESFEGGVVPPTNWASSGSTAYLYATGSFSSPAQSPHSGSYQLMWQSYNAQSGTTASLATPSIDWSYRGGNTPTVSFWMYRDVTAYDNSAYDAEGVNVYASSSQSSGGGELLGFVPRRGGAAATGTYLASGVPTTATSGWYQYTFNIPSNYNGTVNYIVFDFYSQYGNNTFVDDIEYVAYPNPISINVNPSTTCTNQPITATSICTAPDPYYYYWSWGDGSTYWETGTASTTHSYSSTGYFNVYSEVYDQFWNYLGSNYTNVSINGGTNGNIYLSKTDICPGEQIYIDPAGNSSPLKWMVNGVTIGTPGSYSVNHTFPTLGTYTVSGVFSTPCGDDTISRIVNVNNTIFPDAGFSFNPNPSVCPNVNVQVSPYEYTGTHSWDFGDGYTSTLQSPYHPYSSLGTQTITHSITNSCGNTSTASNNISVDNSSVPSNANFGFYPNTPLCPGVQITFNSQNYEGQWSWDFGDGVTATGINPRHTYTAIGNYTVTHTITNACNNVLSSSQVIAITDTITPNATFNVSPSVACPNDIISFNPNEQNGSVYFWDFGDGFTSTLKYPSHQYNAVGSYTASLTVTNTCNITNTSTFVVQINGNLPLNLNANLNAYPQPACPSQPINFNVSAYGYPRYVWNYGDGIIDTTSNTNISHAYSAAGVYTASVKISNNCGRDTTLYTTININSSIPFPSTMLSANPSSACPGESVSANAPWGFPSYVWNLGDGSPLISSSNSYISYAYSTTGNKIISVNVTDYCGNDTTYQDTVSIINRTTFCAAACSLNVYTNSPACPNQAIYFNAPQGYAWYKFKFGDGDSIVSSSAQTTHSYSGVGAYNYTVTITNFCGTDTTIYSSVEINNSQQINNWTNVYAYPDIVCPNQAVQFNTDNNYNTYVWDFGDGYIANGTGTVAHTYTVAGTYNTSVTITNACGNSASFSTTITVDNSASFPNWMNMWVDQEPSCPGSPVTLRTTEGYLSYHWNFGDGDTITTSTGTIPHVYAAAGNYSASVTITNSCGLSTTIYKTVNISNSVNINYLELDIPNNPACVDDIVMLNINTGAGGMGGNSLTGITFVWNYGDGSPLDTTTGVGSSHVYATTGVYNVIVTATNSCGNSRTASKMVTINGSAVPQLNSYNFGILSQNMNGNGSISVCPGDVLVFYFEGINSNNVWDFGDGSTATAVDVITGADGNSYTIIRHAYTTAGIYNYSLTLGNHCGNNVSQTKQVTVTSGMLISGGLEIEAPSSALGYTTCGLINFISFGGNDFVWDFGDGTTLSTASPMASHSYANAGNYIVKVTVTNGCGNSATYIKTLIVNGVGGTVVSALSIVSPTCNNGTDGSAAVNVSGGSAPYIYNWTNSIGQSISTSDAAANLAAGTYSVVVTDVSGCEGYATITLNDPSSISTIISVTPSSCGGATGTASVTNVTGGTAPYTYSWSNGQTSATANGLALGTYTVTVQDNKGCSFITNASISENGATVSVVSTTNVTCNGGNNGGVTTNITGGTAPYTYLWSNGATTQNISGVSAGTYSVVVTDNGGCQATISTSISQPSAMNINVVTLVSPTCGNFDGSAQANVSGGTGPYTYLWSAGGTTQTKTGLPRGTYTVTITDANGCSSDGIITLSNSNAPAVAAVVNNISCNGQTNGSIDLTVTGGTSPYLYTWSTGSGNQDITGLSVGLYIVTIQDAAGCFSMRNYNITQPNALTATASSTGATCGNNNGTATATPVGGNTSFTYSWTGTGQTTQTVTGLALGGYTVTVTDDKGCTATANTTVTSTVSPVEICLVTVDSLSTHNIIMWDKTSVTGVDSFRIYREDVTNVYTHIGTVAYDSLSEYHDMDPTANPNATTKRYKIAAVDACGLESAKSKYHNTLYIISVGSGQFTWNPIYTIENSSNPVNNYLLMRDDLSNGTWAQIQSTAGTQNTITDPAFASFPNASYRVEADWNITCEATRGAINTTRSNIKSPSSIGIKENLLSEIVSIAPNPAHASVTIYIGNTKNNKIKMHNSLGQLIYEQVEGGNKHTINIAEFMTGVYFVTIENELGKTTKKLIIE